MMKENNISANEYEGLNFQKRCWDIQETKDYLSC